MFHSAKNELLLCVLFILVFVLQRSASFDLGLGKSHPIPGSPDITDLNAVNFNTTLLGLRGSQNAIIEFYASWCPHCRHFAPEYKRAAAYLRQLEEVKPLFIGRVDCAVEVRVCGMFEISSYPSLMLATVQQFVNVSKDRFQKFPLKAHHTAAADVVAWVGTSLNITLPELTTSWQAPGVSPDPAVQASKGGSIATWDVRDVERATIMMMQQSAVFLKGPEARTALRVMLALWTTAHPSSRCMAGAEKLKKKLPRIWPAGAESPGVELRSFHICEDAEEEPWGSCAGSQAQYRGYTCGLWTMWHTISVRLPEDNGGRLLFAALKAFAGHFFQCEVCRSHFSQLLTQAEGENIKSRQDAVMWLWRTHNQVNKRLESEEKNQGSGDPAFPKQQFPSAELCAECRGDSKSKNRKDLTPEWHEEEVEQFLMRHYGPHTSQDTRRQEQEIEAVKGAESHGVVEEEELADPAADEKGGAGAQALVLGQDGQANRPHTTLPGQHNSSHLHTILAVIAMALIMAWYCSSARGHKEVAASREAAALTRHQENTAAVGRRKVRVGLKPLH